MSETNTLSQPQKTKRRSRRSKSQWQQLIVEQAESALSQEAFCRENNLGLSTFQKWKRNLAGESAVNTGNTENNSDWIALPLEQLDQSTIRDWDLELELGQGVVLRLRHR